MAAQRARPSADQRCWQLAESGHGEVGRRADRVERGGAVHPGRAHASRPRAHAVECVAGDEPHLRDRPGQPPSSLEIAIGSTSVPYRSKSSTSRSPGSPVALLTGDGHEEPVKRLSPRELASLARIATIASSAAWCAISVGSGPVTGAGGRPPAHLRQRDARQLGVKLTPSFLPPQAVAGRQSA